MKSIFHSLKYSFLHFFYPSRCIHCNEILHPEAPLFCQTCATLLDPLDPAERCSFCFGPIQMGSKCSHEHGKRVFYQIGSVFDYVGPAASLIKKLKYSNQPHLAKGAGAFLVAQFDRLKWPLPDAIIPVPISSSHWIGRGYNQSELIANEMGRLLGIPVWNALKRKSGDYSQAGLNQEQRKALSRKRFRLRKDYPIEDKTLLIIDDVMTSGSTLNRCGEVLAEKCPAVLYALTFCCSR